MLNQIVIIEPTGLRAWAIEELQKHAVQPIQVYNDIPSSKEKVIQRIGDADCVFVSWNVQLDQEILSQCKKLRYIGMCCSLYSKESANVDIDNCEAQGIEVTGIRDYGDEGLVEYIISELIRLIKGLGKARWKEEPVELTQRKIGIIGMGASGQMLANRLQAFGADIYYHSRNRKPEADKKGYQYLPLPELLQTCEIVSLHLPKNTSILDVDEFSMFGNGKILINTSLGFTFSKTAFDQWIARKGNYAIFDGDGIGPYHEDFATHENVITTALVSGWTREAKERLSRKVLNNFQDYLKV